MEEKLSPEEKQQIIADKAPEKPFAEEVVEVCKEFTDEVRKQLGIVLTFKITARRDGNGADVVFYRGGHPMTLGDFQVHDDESLGRYHATYVVRETPTQNITQMRTYQHIRHFKEVLGDHLKEAIDRQTAAEKAKATQAQIDKAMVQAQGGKLMQIDCADMLPNESKWRVWGFVAIVLLIAMLGVEFLAAILAAYDTYQAIGVAEAIHADLIAEHLQAGMFQCIAAAILSAGAIIAIVRALLKSDE